MLLRFAWGFAQPDKNCEHEINTTKSLMMAIRKAYTLCGYVAVGQRTGVTSFAYHATASSSSSELPFYRLSSSAPDRLLNRNRKDVGTYQSVPLINKKECM